MIPSSFYINNLNIETLSIFLILAFIVSMFVFWYEARCDGFDEERIIDMFFTSTIVSGLLLRIAIGLIHGTSSESLMSFALRFWDLTHLDFSTIQALVLLVSFWGTAVIFARLWKWSIYRIGDIAVLSFSSGLVISLTGLYLISNDSMYLIYSVLYLILFGAFRYFRLKVTSGLITSTFMIFLVLSYALFSRNLVDLLFYTLLTTISIGNLFTRENMVTSNLPKSFINKVKAVLQRKEKELDAEQQRLLEEDPYMAEGRDSDNEYLDDVQEDIGKNLVDLRVESITQIKIRIKKALAKINIGSYGICDICGKPIKRERLEAYPEATTCVEHADQEE